MDLRTFLQLDVRGAVAANIRYLRRAEGLRLVGDKNLLIAAYREYSEVLRQHTVELPEVDILYLPAYQFSKNPFARHEEAAEHQDKVREKLGEFGSLFGCYIKSPHLVVVDVDLKPSGELWEKLVDIVLVSSAGSGLSRQEAEKLLLFGLSTIAANSVRRRFGNLQVYVSTRGFHVPLAVKEMVYASATMGVPSERIGQLLVESGLVVGKHVDPILVSKLASRLLEANLEVIPGYSKVLPHYDLVLHATMLPWIKCIRSLSRATKAEEQAGKIAALALEALAGLESGNKDAARQAIEEIDVVVRETGTDTWGFNPSNTFTRLLVGGRVPVETVRGTLDQLVGYLVGGEDVSVRVGVVGEWSPLGLRGVGPETQAVILAARRVGNHQAVQPDHRSVIISETDVGSILKSFARERGYRCLELLVDGPVRVGYRFRALVLLLDLLYHAQVVLRNEDLVSLCRISEKWGEYESWVGECLKRHIPYLVRNYDEGTYITRYPFFGAKLAREAAGEAGLQSDRLVSLPEVAELYTGISIGEICGRCPQGRYTGKCPIRYTGISQALRILGRRLREYMVAREVKKSLWWSQ